MNPKLFDSKIEEFKKFCDDMDNKLGKKLSNKFEHETVDELWKTVKESSEPCTLPEQIRLNKRIATLLMTLGTLASKRVKMANTAYRWLRWRRKAEWSPAKSALQKSL